MAEAGGKRERLEQVIQMFKVGGTKFTSNVTIPMKAALDLHEEGKTPATKEIYDQSKEIVDVDAKNVEEKMKEIAKVLQNTYDDMDKMGLLS